MKNLLLVLCAVISVSIAYGQTNGDYRTVVTGDWNAAATWERYDGFAWQPATVAPANTDGSITLRSPNVVTANSAITADQVTVNAGATLIISVAFALADAMGTDLTVNGGLELGAAISGPGATTINGTMDWSAGTITTPLTIAAAATLTISGIGSKALNTTLQNSGNLNWTGGNIDFNSGSLSSDGNINISTDGSINNGTGSNSLSNLGSLTKSAGTGTNTSIGVSMTNSGSITVNAGTLIKATSSLTNTGAINIAAGAEFRNNISLVLNSGSVVNGSGTMTLGGPVTSNTPMSFPATLLLSQLGGSSVSGTGTFTINGTMNWTGGTMGAPLIIAATATLNGSSGTKTLTNTLTNNGTISWSAGNFNYTNGTLNNNSLIEMTGDGSMIVSGAGTNVLNNSGTFLKSGGTTGGISVPFNNAGTITVNSGTLTSSGITNLNSGTVLTGTGTLAIDGTVNVNLPVSAPSSLTIRKSSGTTAGTDVFTINGPMNWVGGSLGSPFTIVSGASLSLSGATAKALNSTLINNGTINWSGGTFDFNNGTLNNNSIVNNSFDGTMNNTSGTNVLNNTGNFNKTLGTGSSTIVVPFNNSGTVAVNTGTLVNNSSSFINTGVISITASRTFSNTGTLQVQAGSSLTGSGTFSQSGTINFSADLSIPSTITTNLLTAGTTSGTGTCTINGTLNWSGGTIGSPFILAASATVTASGAAKSLNSSLTNNSTISWTAGTIGLTNGTLVNNGTINQSFDGTLDDVAGTNSFSNTGTFSKSGGSGVSTVEVPSTNTGTINGTGSISFTSTFTNNGTISPGRPIGILSMSGSVSPLLTSSSNLAIEILDGTGAGTGHDQLLPAGNLVLNGNFTVTETGTVPAGTYVVVSLSSGTISGAFSTTNVPASYFVAIDATTISLTKSILPVNWISFTGRNAGSKNILNWATDNENNNARFEIERSIDGRNYVLTGVLKAKATDEKKEYVFEDASFTATTNYYRLKQVDLDGNFEYSKTIVVKSDNPAISSIKIYPNPAKGQASIIIPENWLKADVIISTVSGQAMKEFIQVNQRSLVVDLLPGTYFIRFRKGNSTVVEKLIVE